MPISGITSGFAGYAKRITGGEAPQPTAPTKPSAAAAALQESTETPDVTAKEARAGDKVAIRKLARGQSQTQPTTTTSTRPSSGNGLDRVA